VNDSFGEGKDDQLHKSLAFAHTASDVRRSQDKDSNGILMAALRRLALAQRRISSFFSGQSMQTTWWAKKL
jgi:hypothetical protein